MSNRRRSARRSAGYQQSREAWSDDWSTVVERTLSGEGAAYTQSKRPAIDISQGIVWCYVHGYLQILNGGGCVEERLRHLLPTTPASQPQSQPYGRVVLLCPASGTLPTADDLYSRFKIAGTAQPVRADVAGTRGRSYGEHTVIEVQGKLSTSRTCRSAFELCSYLMAVEPVNSLRTLRMVAEALMKDDDRENLDVAVSIEQVVTMLESAVQGDRELCTKFAVVKYETDDEAERKLKELVQIRCVAQSAEVRVMKPAPIYPLSVGAYLAWSFFIGYLENTCRKQHVPTSLKNLTGASQFDPEKLSIPVKKVIIVCPLELPPAEEPASDSATNQQQPAVASVSGEPELERIYYSSHERMIVPRGYARQLRKKAFTRQQRLSFFDDMRQLLSDVTPMYDVSGVTSDVAELPVRRTFGAFTLFQPERTSSDAFALEMATPLRTLAVGMVGELTDGEADDVYREEARSFVSEMFRLMRKRPEVAEQYAIATVDSRISLTQALKRLVRQEHGK